MSSSLKKSRRRRRGGRRHSKYHKLAYRNSNRKQLASILEAADEDCFSTCSETSSESGSGNSQEEDDFRVPRRGHKSDRHRLVHEAKAEIISELAQADGDTSSVHRNLHKLSLNYDSSNFDPRADPNKSTRRNRFAVCGPAATRLEGTWMALLKPNFAGCLGTNQNGDYLYTLGRMAFDMFQPTQLICSIQGTFTNIKLVDRKDEHAIESMPARLRADVSDGKVPVRTYNIVTAFTIEPGKPGDTGPNAEVDEPVEGTMTTYGYCLPYPTGNRFSVWFTSGCLEMGVDEADSDRWRQVFDKACLPGRTLAERSKLFAAKLLMGAETSDDMDDNGKISYRLARPMAANIDLVYLDGMTLMTRGKSGTVYAASRVQDAEDVSSDEEELEVAPVCMQRRNRKWSDDAPISIRQKQPQRSQESISPRQPQRSQESFSSDDSESSCSKQSIQSEVTRSSVGPRQPQRSQDSFSSDASESSCSSKLSEVNCTCVGLRQPQRAPETPTKDDTDCLPPKHVDASGNMPPKQPARRQSLEKKSEEIPALPTPNMVQRTPSTLAPRRPSRRQSLEKNLEEAPVLPMPNRAQTSSSDASSTLAPRRPSRRQSIEKKLEASPAANCLRMTNIDACPKKPNRFRSNGTDVPSMPPRRCESPFEPTESETVCPETPLQRSTPTKSAGHQNRILLSHSISKSPPRIPATTAA